MTLFINQEKTKYMPVTKKSQPNYPHHLEVGSYKFQVIYSFTYLRSDVNCNNDNKDPKTYLTCKQVFPRPKKASEVPSDLKNTKILMYKVLFRPVLIYASEIWTLDKANERWLSLFERKVLRCIFGAKHENGTWQKRYNYELYEINNEPNIVKYIKVKRLAWAGHLVHMNSDRTIKKIFNTKTDGARSAGILEL